jgi:hypothetical protein
MFSVCGSLVFGVEHPECQELPCCVYHLAASLLLSVLAMPGEWGSQLWPGLLASLRQLGGGLACLPLNPYHRGMTLGQEIFKVLV